MASLVDIGWTAGFLEGEGCFGSTKLGNPTVRGTQNEREPLERLQALYGGSIMAFRPRADRRGDGRAYCLDCNRASKRRAVSSPTM